MFAKRISCLFLIFLFMLTVISPALAQETPEPTLLGEGTDEVAADNGEVTAPEGETDKEPEPTTNVTRANFECHSPSTHPEEKVLKPEEVEKMKQALNVDSNGFQGREIPSVSPPDEDRKELGNPQSAVVIPTGKEGEATLQDIPTQKFLPEEMKQWLFKHIDGAYSTGLSLDDTLRVGRCADLDKMKSEGIPCPLANNELKLRNSGEGIIADFKLVGSDMKDIFGELGDFITGDEKETGLSKEEEEEIRKKRSVASEEELETLKTNMAGETDLNDLEGKSFKRVSEEFIPNHVQTESFEVSMGSACNTADCFISSYSQFDKYYNSWFAADLVISNFGPTLFGQAKRYLGWPARKGFPLGSQLEQNRFMKSIRRKFMGPDSAYGTMRAKRITQRMRKNGFGKDFWDKMATNADWDSGYTAIKGGSFEKWLSAATAKGGYLDELTDPVQRGEFFKMIRDLRGYSRTNRDMVDFAKGGYDDAIKAFGAQSTEAKSALVDYARTNYRIMDQMDDQFYLDVPEWWLRDEFSNLHTYAVKNTHSNSIVSLTSDSQHIDSIARPFVQDGHFGALRTAGNKSYEITQDGAVQLYKLSDAGRIIDTVPVEDLQKNFSRYVDKAVMTERGEMLYLNSTNLDKIVSEAGTGKVQVYAADWVKGPTLTPEEFASKVTHSRVGSRIASNFNKNMNQLYDTLVEKNFAGMSRRYYSILDKSFANEAEIFKSYLSFSGGAKLTVKPILYWGAKRGFGQEGFSAYMLPDEWKEIDLYLGDSEIYNDAFVDFFANHGSDEGDIFRQVINKLPWKVVYNYIVDTFGVGKETYDKLTGKGFRPDVENVAYFTGTGDECAGCQANLRLLKPETGQTGKGELSLNFSSKQKMDTFLLEDAISKDAKESGSTLIAFGHHVNLNGHGEGGNAGEPTNIVEGQKEEETCRDKVRELGLGWVGENPARVGGMLAFSESIGYFIFGWAGIMGSALQQTLIAPRLQNCVDDFGGYYVHIFAPSDKEKEDTKGASEIASETSMDVIKELKENLFGEEDGEVPQGFVEAVQERMREQVNSLEDQQRSSNLLQTTISTQGSTTAATVAKELFFFWFKGETNAARYDTESQTMIVDPETDTNILIDNKAGEIVINGKPVITSKDHVRLSAPNTEIPAHEVPQRIGELLLPSNSDELMFTWGMDGRFTVAPVVLNCIKTNIEEQTGVGISTDDITEAFGEVKTIITDTHSVMLDSKNESFIAVGTPRRIVNGPSAKTEVLANRKTILKNGEEANAGLLESVQFEHGVIIYKPETHELIIWLKRNAKAIANRSDISGLKATPTTVKNPITDCPEPAIDLEALPVPGSDAKAEKVENFNTSLDLMGPFQTFDTDTHRFIFYSELLNDGTCEDRVKIINKETGEIYDQALVGPVENTPEGIKFNTEDGKEHTLDFSADDGVPKVSYNGGPPEVLRTATGPNGSFWYDPTTGQWYPENAQLIPLIEAFKQNGINTAVGPDGRVNSTPTGNNLSVQIGSGSDMPFNLPSLPEHPVVMLAFLFMLMAAFVASRIAIERWKGIA